MHKKECIAMILAGGMGTRLSRLTTTIAKPAMPFGVKHRLIDFTISNCTNSFIDTVGVLMPPIPFKLCNQLIWPSDKYFSGKTAIYPLLPEAGKPYRGTADAIFANIAFIERYNPELVMVLSGDHIYKMDYRSLVNYHKKKSAAATIAVIGVPWMEAGRFGIMDTDAEGRITSFIEKPPHPPNNLASMGVYVFHWPTLRNYLRQDAEDPSSSHDFGKNVIPKMLAEDVKLYAYPFNGYWKDVGTVESLYEAHMELLGKTPIFSLIDDNWPIHSSWNVNLGRIIPDPEKNTLRHDTCIDHGRVEGSVLYPNVRIGRNALVRNSVLLPGAVVGECSHIERAIIGPGSIIEKGYTLQGGTSGMPLVAVIGENSIVTNETTATIKRYN